MTLIVEIACQGPRPLAAFTHYRVICEALRERCAVRWPDPWLWVRPLPRHPDWQGACRMMLAAEGRLVPGLDPPALLRLLEAHYRVALPDYDVAIAPVFDPALVLPDLSPPPRHRALAAGELHQLLNPNG